VHDGELIMLGMFAPGCRKKRQSERSAPGITFVEHRLIVEDGAIASV
jgi:hypothetical protein